MFELYWQIVMEEVKYRLNEIEKKLEKISQQNKWIIWGVLVIVVLIINSWYWFLHGLTSILGVSTDEFNQAFITDTITFVLIVISVSIAGYMMIDIFTRFIKPRFRKTKS